MSSSPVGDGSDPSGGPRDEKRQPWPAVVGAAAVGAAVTAGVTSIMGRLPVWLAFLVIIVVGIFVLATVFRRRVAKWAMWALPAILSGVIAFPLALAANAIWDQFGSDPACGRPIDLRVIAAPETVTALRHAAQAYEQDRCPAVTISVVPEPPIAGMKAGFAQGWVESSVSPTDTLYGPQPDIWIADSKIVADGVLKFVQRSNSGDGKAHLDVEQPIASSPIVLGLFGSDTAGAAEHGIPQDGVSNGTPLSTIINDLHTSDILGSPDNVVRAAPDTSESALLATPALYSASPGRQVEQNQIRLPEQVLGSAQAFPDGTAMLCYFRKEQGSGAKPPNGTAILLPEQSVFTYDSGDALGTSCLVGTTWQDWKLYPYYATDLPVLDYTFVHVRWAGQDDAGRYRTVEDFQQWLIKNSATALPGFRDPEGRAEQSLIERFTEANANDPGPPPTTIRPGFPRYRRCGGDLTSIMNCYAGARPRLVATILLDVSGSMAQPTVSGSSRLAWAQQTGEGIARLANPQDSLSFLPFAHSVNPPQPIWPRSQQELISYLDEQVANNWDTPLATKIDHIIGTLPSGRQNVVILTDGQNTHTNRGYTASASKLAADIRAHHPGLRVFLALTSGASCTSEPVKTLASALHSVGAGDCVPASSSPAASAAELFTDLLK
jgi:hypothetical protein